MLAAFHRRSKTAHVLAAATACLCAALAHAQAGVSALKLEFVQPTGLVSATDSITVSMRLTNTDSSQAFSFAPSTGMAGLPAESLPKTAWAWNATTSTYEEIAFSRYTGFGIGVGYSCSSTFSKPDCHQGPYAFTFGDTGMGGGFTLAAGQSYEYVHGVLAPLGTTPPGTYTLFTAPLYMMVMGFSADNRALTGTFQLANTCNAAPADCAASGLVFSRTVSAVPEPASAALLGLGLLAVLATRRRQG